MGKLNLGFKMFKENLWLWFVPLSLNFLEYLIEVSTKSIQLAPSGVHFRFHVPNGLPEISKILQQAASQGAHIDSSPIKIIFIILLPFFAGGFISSIFKLLEGKEVSKASFWNDCKYYFLRLLFVTILTFILFLVAIITTMAYPYFTVPVLLIIIYLTYFWQLALVKEDLKIGVAFDKGRAILSKNLFKVLVFIIPLGIFTAIISVPINFLAHTVVGYALAIIIWTFIGSIIATAVMSFYSDLIELNSL